MHSRNLLYNDTKIIMKIYMKPIYPSWVSILLLIFFVSIKCFSALFCIQIILQNAWRRRKGGVLTCFMLKNSNGFIGAQRKLQDHLRKGLTINIDYLALCCSTIFCFTHRAQGPCGYVKILLFPKNSIFVNTQTWYKNCNVGVTIFHLNQQQKRSKKSY